MRNARSSQVFVVADYVIEHRVVVSALQTAFRANSRLRLDSRIEFLDAIRRGLRNVSAQSAEHADLAVFRHFGVLWIIAMLISTAILMIRVLRNRW